MWCLLNANEMAHFLAQCPMLNAALEAPATDSCARKPYIHHTLSVPINSITPFGHPFGECFDDPSHTSALVHGLTTVHIHTTLGAKVI